MHSRSSYSNRVVLCILLASIYAYCSMHNMHTRVVVCICILCILLLLASMHTLVVVPAGIGVHAYAYELVHDVDK